MTHTQGHPGLTVRGKAGSLLGGVDGTHGGPSDPPAPPVSSRRCLQILVVRWCVGQGRGLRDALRAGVDHIVFCTWLYREMAD